MWHTRRDQVAGGAPDRQPKSTSGFLVGVVPYLCVKLQHAVAARGTARNPAPTSTGGGIASKLVHLEVDDVHHDVACQGKRKHDTCNELVLWLTYCLRNLRVTHGGTNVQYCGGKKKMTCAMNMYCG